MPGAGPRAGDLKPADTKNACENRRLIVGLKPKGFGRGGEEEDRTPDLCIANAALSQLSYFPKPLRKGILP